MSQPNTAHTAPEASSSKMLRAMVGIGILCALMIVLTYEGTATAIEKNKAEALQKALFEVLPGTATTRAYELNQDKQFVALEAPDAGEQVVYAGFDENGALTGVAIEAAGQGYADIIRILYGYDPAQEAIVGFYVLESKETPGLGDKIEKDPVFLANFEALDVSLNDDRSALNNPIVTVKSGAKERPWEVDGITGATISSRAIGDILAASTQQWIPLIYQNQDSFTVQENAQ